MKAKSGVLGALSISLVVLALCGCGRRRSGGPLGPGYQWLSWKPEQRQIYVGGFLDGQGAVQMDLCQDFESSIDSIRLHRDVHLNFDERPCEHFRLQYTHRQIGTLDAYTRAYVSVINDFYKHPECRMMPYSTLMEHLSDKEYRPGEELFQAVRAGSVAWGSFSIEGIDRCLGPHISSK